MIRNLSFLSNFVESYEGSVTFGNMKKGKICSKGTLAVDGLKFNLVSITQLCDQEMLVTFTKDKCVVTSRQNEEILEGSRTFDNYYKFVCHLGATKQEWLI